MSSQVDCMEAALESGRWGRGRTRTLVNAFSVCDEDLFTLWKSLYAYSITYVGEGHEEESVYSYEFQGHQWKDIGRSNVNITRGAVNSPFTSYVCLPVCGI